MRPCDDRDADRLWPTHSPDALAPAIEHEIHGLEPDLPLYDVQNMKKALDGGYGLFAVRTAALFAVVLAGFELTLAVVGLSGMVSYMTSERRHEIGVRIALGANPKHIATMVIGEATKLMVAGTVIGLIGAFALACW